MKKGKIKTLFLDIGGVLLSNGWDHTSRNKAVTYFKLDSDEINERHHLTFDTYEEGKLTLHEYLKRVVFYEKRKFSEEHFIKFMFEQSYAYPDTINFFKEFKKQHNLRVVAVSNEGRELNDYRIKKFKLNKLFDGFISSSYVHLRKPDVDMFRMASDIAHTPPKNAVYVDDRLMFVQIAKTLGMHGLHHTGLEETKKQLKMFKFGV